MIRCPQWLSEMDGFDGEILLLDNLFCSEKPTVFTMDVFTYALQFLNLLNVTWSYVDHNWPGNHPIIFFCNSMRPFHLWKCTSSVVCRTFEVYSGLSCFKLEVLFQLRNERTRGKCRRRVSQVWQQLSKLLSNICFWCGSFQYFKERF